MNTAMRLAINTLFACLQFAAYGQVGQSNVVADPPSPSDVGRQFDDSVPSGESESNQSGSTGDGIGASPLSNELSLGETDMISVDFPNEEIRTVLRNIADLYMLNIVIPEELQGTTSIKLRDVSWRQIFDVVLEPVGYTYVEEGNIIQIISNDTLNFEPPITDIFMLNYAEAAEIAPTVTSMVDPKKGGIVQIDTRTNGLIVTERQSRMASIKRVIERLDKPTLQVMIETRFVEVANNDITKIGTNWNSLESLEVGVGELSRGYRHVSDGGSTFGAQRSFSNIDGGVSKAYDNLKTLATASDTTRTATALFSSSEIGFIFSALKRDGNSRLVSHPTVVTLNNQEAEISIGEQFPIPNYQYNEERGTFEVSGFEYKDIGVILKVKPSVNNEGLITLRVTPEVSSRTGEREFGGASGASIPIISTRRTTTQVSLKDGYTMGLGGLLQANDLDVENKVPVLSRIPGIGGVFRQKEKDHQKLNLLIFITAKILSVEDSDFQDVFSSSQMEDVGIDPDAVMNQ